MSLSCYKTIFSRGNYKGEDKSERQVAAPSPPSLRGGLGAPATFAGITQKQKLLRRDPKEFCLCWHLLIFPGRRQPSIVSRNELNYRVRNGNGWTLVLISTNFVFQISPENFFNYKGFTSLCQERLGDPYRIRTDVNGVRGRCLNHLTNGPWCTFTDSNRGPTD